MAVHLEWNGYHNVQEMASAECDSAEVGDMIYDWHPKGHEHTFESDRLSAARGSTRYFKCSAHCTSNGGFFATTCPDSPSSRFVPVDGGIGRACRGSSSSDNLAEYYTLSSVWSLDECKDLCAQTSGCKGIEFKEGRCEVWTRPAGIEASVAVSGYTCLRYAPDPTTSPAPPSTATTTMPTTRTTAATTTTSSSIDFPPGCQTVQPGHDCYEEVVWAMETGINQNPEWYPGLTTASTFEQFQAYLHEIREAGVCPEPCASSPPAPSPSEPTSPSGRRLLVSESTGLFVPSGDKVRALQVEGAVDGPTGGGPATSAKRTIYYFTSDGSSDMPTFRGSNWPYVKVPTDASIEVVVDFPVTVAEGLDGILLVDGKPAYQFAGDSSAGSAAGQGRGSVWYVFETSAESPSPPTTQPSPPAPSPAVSEEWTSHPGTNCYAGNGAEGIYNKDPLDGDFSVQACKNECLLEPACDGIVMPRGDGPRTCWLRQKTRLDDCPQGTSYDYWARPDDGSFLPSPAPSPAPPPSPVPAPVRPPPSAECPPVRAACSETSSQDWTITESCTLQQGRYSFRKLAIMDGAVVNVQQGASISIDLTGGLFVGEGAELWIGCEGAPFTGSLLATFRGGYTDLQDAATGFTVKYEDHGLPRRTETWHNGLLVGHGARLEIHGQRKTSWGRLSEDALAGSSVLMLDRTPQGWRIGDEIIVTSTSQSKDETEVCSVDGIDGNRVTLSSSLRHDHTGHWIGRGQRLNAEVGILTHNIHFTSDVNEQTCAAGFRENPPGEAAKSQCFGGQVAFLQHSMVHVESAEFSKLGQGLLMGRYSLHFHLAGDAEGSYLRDNSIHHGFNRCITLHGTFNAVLDGNVCFENRGHNIYLEDGIEAGNQILSNLVVNPERSATICSDFFDIDWVRKPSQAGIWITNPNNTFMGNVVVGAQFGVWFTFPPCDGEPYSDDRGTCGGVFGASRAYFGDAASGYGPTSWVNRQEQSRTRTIFHNNTIKGSQRTGLFIDGKIIDSEDPRIPCLENAGQWEHTECGTCPLVRHSFKWGPMDFDIDMEPSRRWYRPVPNVLNDIVVAYNAGGQGGFGADDFSFWSSGGAVSFERAIFAYNRQGASVVNPGDQCASHINFGASGYTAQYRNTLWLGSKGTDRGAPAFRYYDGGFRVLNSRWVGLDFLVEMREASGGNTNGLLMTDSAPLGWFNSDSQDELYKWLFDSGRVNAEFLPRASTVPDLADWRSNNIDRPENVHLITTNGFGDHLQFGFRQFVYDRSSEDIGWGPHVRVEQGSPQCRQFYKCRYGWCGTGVDCSSYHDCDGY
eukprot:TRINITY_DN3111_c0_g1_i1.p1 TRINITY_DN3111_c0_g1~~TRINITY_DN3111_c0_g1_i1.p1  ORF type:complete len:1315 (-),score=165.95 TRINITY_DN3111_c0_g1_i1:391-4314(-)